MCEFKKKKKKFRKYSNNVNATFYIQISKSADGSVSVEHTCRHHKNIQILANNIAKHHFLH